MPEHDGDFFVGYLPMPPGLRRFTVAAAIVLMLSVAVVAAIVAIGQRDPGAGSWQAQTREFTGSLDDSTYPLLRTVDGSMLLVDQGKSGAIHRVGHAAGKVVTLRGTRIERDGLAIIEITEGDDAISLLPQPPTGRQPIIGSREVTLRGEIVDSKCYAGAMKPGDGKAHKACAVLCIRGGIPPVFVDESGERYLLLVDSVETILPFVGDRVEICGIVKQQGDLHILQPHPAKILRLSP